MVGVIHAVRLGFQIRDDSPPTERVPGTRARTPRTSSSTPRASGVRSTGTPRTTRVAATDRPDKLCPTCFIALPATGICDQCD